MARILVADDDAHIREVIRFALERAGHDVVEACDGAEAEAKLDESIDLGVFDIMMPEKSGLEIVRDLRKNSNMPVVFVSSRDEELDLVLGLELGGDDYITKPFKPRELVARVGAVLRRSGGSMASKEVLHFEGLSMDLDNFRTSFAGKELTLTVTEFNLLQALMRRQGRVVERAAIIDEVYGGRYALSDRTVDSHIRRIRAKLRAAGANLLQTVYGVGYRLEKVDKE